jgi:hypothetical protein
MALFSFVKAAGSQVSGVASDTTGPLSANRQRFDAAADA